MTCLTDLPKSKKEAKEVGSTYYYTGKPCKRGHVNKRFSVSGVCYDCHLLHSKTYYERYHEESVAKRSEWRKENPDYFKQWKKQHPSYMSEYCKVWREDNPDYRKEYYDKNSAKFIAKENDRRSKKLQRTFEGYEKEILSLYEDCVIISNETGVKHHVDHIVPLNGENVSGLHVPWNLQIITAEENLKKGNKLLNPFEIFNRNEGDNQ